MSLRDIKRDDNATAVAYTVIIRTSCVGHQSGEQHANTAVRNRGRVTRIHKVIVLKSGTRREQRVPVGITPADYPFADISAANVIRNRIPDAFISLLSRLDGFLFNLRIRLTAMTVMTMRDATLQISSLASPPLSSSRCRYPNAFDYYHYGATSTISCFPYVRS